MIDVVLSRTFPHFLFYYVVTIDGKLISYFFLLPNQTIGHNDHLRFPGFYVRR